MAIDISKQGTKGGDPQYNTSNLTGVREERGIVKGVVKANVHGAHMGVLKVWIPTFSTDPTSKSQWRTVRYCTPFYSRVDNQGPLNNYMSTKVSSGIVTPPPDLGTEVLCFFPEGRNAEGYYFACVPDTFMLQSVPEATLTNDGTPGGEFNDNPAGERSSKKITNFKKEPRPTDFFTQSFIRQQGLTDDKVRGINNSGYMRESPSELIGISSKGRRITEQGADFLTTYNSQVKNPDTADKKIIDGLLGPSARRKGHSITLDDGDIDGNSNQVRLRTSTGHQILLNDSEGVVYVGNSTGSCWIELSNNGTMDVYAQDSINFRSKNLNFHADQNIKFHSKGYTQIVSDQQLALEGKAELTVSSDGELGITGKKNLHLHSSSELFATSTGASYYNSGGIMSVAGAMVLLQGPKTQAKQAKKINVAQKEDTTFDQASNQFILDKQQSVSTTVDRITMHEPFIGHGSTNTATPYSGGLVGGGGSPLGGFSILPLPVSLPVSLPGLSPGALGGAIPGGLADSVLGQAGGLTSQFTSVAGSFGDITSNLPINDLTSQFAGAAGSLAGADLGSFTTDISGKITGMASQLQTQLPSLTGELTKLVPQLPDQLSTVLNSPSINKFPVTDMVKQLNTGFSVGALDSIDTQALNAAVVKGAGSLNNPQFIDSLTKSVGKFGVNVEQLKEQGFVRPDAIFNDQLSDSSVWTGKAGASSLNKFLSNEGLQDSIQQGIVASDYQKLVNFGGIKAEDSKEEIISMLTASNASTVDIVSKIRQGASSIENVLPNTTNIPSGKDIASIVKQHMQTGAAAARRVDQIRSDTLKREVEQNGNPVSKQGVAQPNSEAAVKHLEMFSKQAQLSPEQQKQLNETILQIYAGADKANPAE